MITSALKPTELMITRHGEAWCNREQVVGGPHGCRGLTDTGRDQVHRLAARLRSEHHDRPIDAVYTSPLRRVRESAAIVADAWGIDAAVEPDLREADYGDADGRPWSEVVTAFGGIPANEPDRPIAAGAETWTQYLLRSIAALRTILDRHSGQRVLIVGHGETVTTAAHLLLDLPAMTRARAAFAAHPASITVWQQQPLAWTQPDAGWRWTLVRHNDTSHMTRSQGRSRGPLSVSMSAPYQ
ncbi:MAG: histidine phosphatase family protein [Pseudonocardiaceae bacterium]